MSMSLDAAACEWFKLVIDTVPEQAPTAWEASIDGGDTWVAAHNVEGFLKDGTPVDTSAWLVAGPNYQGDSEADFTTTIGSKSLKIRLIDDPETVIRRAGSRITTSL